MSPEELLENKPEDMKYVFIRLAGFIHKDEKGVERMTSPEFLEQYNYKLPWELNSGKDLPPRMKGLGGLPMEGSNEITTIRVIEMLPESPE